VLLLFGGVGIFFFSKVIFFFFFFFFFFFSLVFRSRGFSVFLQTT